MFQPFSPAQSVSYLCVVLFVYVVVTSQPPRVAPLSVRPLRPHPTDYNILRTKEKEGLLPILRAEILESLSSAQKGNLWVDVGPKTKLCLLCQLISRAAQRLAAGAWPEKVRHAQGYLHVMLICIFPAMLQCDNESSCVHVDMLTRPCPSESLRNDRCHL